MDRPLIASAFESELQLILSAGADRERAGAQVAGWDAHVCPNDWPRDRFGLALISIPAFEAVELGTELVTAFKDAGAQRVLLFGQYAWTNAVTFASVADGVVMDEPEALAAGLIDCASQRVSDAQRIAGRPPASSCGRGSPMSALAMRRPASGPT